MWQYYRREDLLARQTIYQYKAHIMEKLQTINVHTFRTTNKYCFGGYIYFVV